jgi:hypothetical protein
MIGHTWIHRELCGSALAHHTDSFCGSARAILCRRSKADTLRPIKECNADITAWSTTIFAIDRSNLRKGVLNTFSGNCVNDALTNLGCVDLTIIYIAINAACVVLKPTLDLGSKL